MKDHEVPKSACPDCGHEMDRAMSTTNDGEPTVGDLSVCIGCGALLRFGEGLRLERLDDFTGIDAETIDHALTARRLVLKARALKEKLRD
jgi:hypothetical protein